tara:strand:- start:11305 stop:20088 length:8784 start_codon:yes stop_codon:yes gene_type:complete
MSIRDLFDRSTAYVSQKNDKEAFADAESSRNVKQIVKKQNYYEPQIDYTVPSSFAKFGSAELYYRSAIDHIVDYYPYDGSDAEYNEFYNKFLDIEKFVFNNLYPRTNGYVNFSSSSISLKGGPHTIASSNTKGLFKDPKSSQRETANIYDEDLYTTEGLPSDYGQGTRESNLKCDFQKGVTIEFWMKNDVLDTNTKQAIFHLTSSTAHDELTIYIKGDSGSPFFTTLRANGTARFTDERIGVTPDTSSIKQWNHYAISFKDTGDGVSTKFYTNGVLEQTRILGSSTFNPLTQKGALAYIASGSHAEGHLFFSGSMDEFRFWKTERTAQDIGRNWFGQVRGGSNTDISNTTLGVYYKFNEGITGDAAQDSVVLDYSGRISNGTFSGYTTTSRNTGSAIVSASAATSEYLDPIIYSNHPSVSSLRADLISKGIDHDYRNTSLFSSFMPSWVTEEHQGLGNDNFKYLSHIIGTYFDRLYLQIEALPTFKSPIYTSASYKPLPFANNLPSSLGLETPDIFVDSTVMEKFLNKNETQSFKFDLNETKNLIYLNLYNNLAYIFKSKGTHKAVKNVLRTFNIDDKLVRFNTYANNYTYELENNLKNTVVRKSSVNFNKAQNLGAVIYSSASSDSTQLGYISSSEVSRHENRYGMTYEADIIFPKFIRLIDPFERDFTRVSLFGIHSASSNLPQTEVFDPSFYVYAQRDEIYSKNVKFVLSSSLLTNEISSSLYHSVYDNENWNLSIRIKPNSIGLTGSVEGVSQTDYTIEFSGYNQRLGEVRNIFKITGSANTTSKTRQFLRSPKRIFAGAHRTNITGALQHRTDVLVTATRYWTKRIDDDSLKQHTLDFENYGVSDASKHLSPLDSDNDKTLNIHTLALNYEFANVTASDGTGGFTITDISSGSVDGINGSYGMLGEISSYLYPGVGFGFQESATDVVLKQEVNSHQFIDPELAISDNLVQIKTDDDKLFDTVDTIPNYHYILEKSMYASISEEMLNFFAGVNDFHNLIGHPVHQYRMNYKGLEKLREIFFRRVTTVSNVEKFVDYYKWFDDAISQIIGQLVPASADYTSDILNTIEPHVLERNKYQHRIPMLAFTSSTEGVAFGAEELRYNWDKNHAPISGLERENSNWWKERAERQGIISSGDANVDSERNQIRRVQTNQTNGGVGRSFTNVGAKYSRSNFKYRTLSKGRVFDVKKTSEIKGGVNFNDDKNIHYTYTALHPAGPITTEDNVYVPRNVLLAFTEDFAALKDTVDSPETPSAKIKRNVLVQHGRDWEDGIGYKNTKSSLSFPFNIISSSVNSGFNKQVAEGVSASVEITNLHNDVYGTSMERPMQGPFTEYAVGGHQSRHVKLNTGADNYLNRPEAWKILLGRDCNVLSGAIGMVGADYPWPEANERGVSPYPLTGAQKAVFFRDEMAKRPVNIRNIQHKTGSTVLGNYDENYQVVHTVGGYSNPRAFIDEQPTIPAKAVGADVVRTILDVHRAENSHFTFIDDYNWGYLTGSGDYQNKTVIVNRFSAPGSRESMTPAFRDLRSGDLSVYNETNNRNLSVRRPFQGVSSSIVSETTGIRNFDHTGKDFGFTNLAARHAGKFFRDSVYQSNPAASDDASTELASFHKTHRNNKITPIDKNGPSTQQKFDNLNIQHQIPRSDRQYSWITSSITHTDPTDPRYAGFMLTDSSIAPYYDVTGTLIPFYDYVTASTTTIDGIYQNTTRLNLLCADPTGSDKNTLGATVVEDGLKDPVIDSLEFNALITRRGDNYGWNWRAFRQQDHPILRIEHENNRLTALKGSEIKDFRLPPVSMKGRPVVVNMDAQGLNISLKATHNNEKIYFNERELNDLVYEKQDTTITPFDQLVDMSRQPGNELNWVHYSETLFPSTRNEFSSGSRERLDFDNGFWRDSRENRTKTRLNSFSKQVQQSIWPLDAQEDFLIRTEIVHASDSDFDFLIENGKAGELQNNYTTYFTSSGTLNIRRNLRAGSLISRKQLLTSPNSVASRTGFAQTASLTNTFTSQIPNYAGEALWEAGTHATIIEKSGSDFVSASHPSEPWFDEYGDFKEELQLVAKDYAIIPEFRISEHISDYVKGGLFNKTKQDNFEIPGTSLDSSQTNFYKDYSNSDFLKEFAEIKQKSGLSAKEIMLTCRAAIRYNPYKGFYPAQRTINLAEQFSSSFGNGFSETAGGGLLSAGTDNSRYLRPLIQPLFAPGIIYNSIKSGIAVDYPVINKKSKIQSYNFSGSSASTENYMIWPPRIVSLTQYNNNYNPNRAFWDLRVPFEAALDPGKYIDKIEFLDFEPHPSSSFNATASMDASVSDGIYELMSKNFFGQTGDFFLKNSSFTKIESDLIQDGLKFKDGEVYAARLKIRKSHNGNRYYNLESGSDGANTYFSNLGALAQSGSGTSLTALSDGYYPLPQDPAHNPDFQETFTMYSRPTAFGPSVTGRQTGSHDTAFLSGTLDSLEGFNWAYTPPYYHGESWVDFIFRPDSSKTYTLEDILSETNTVYWRVDPGQMSGSETGNSEFKNERLLIQNGYSAFGVAASRQAPYGGSVVNNNAMQLDSSLNLFGVERVPKKRKDKFNNTILNENDIAGKRWVIQPKWETPMLNFANVSADNNNITYPTTFSESVPRGMWHQFGEIPKEPSTGVFLEIGDISVDWLKGHYDVINEDSVYNNNDAANSGSTAYLDIKSLSDLFGFQRAQKKDSVNVRLGEIADKREVYEAVVAIPYVIEANEDYQVLTGEDKKNRKKFISIPHERFESALKKREGSQDGDSLATAGESIRKMVQKMKRYVLPPQFDFINFDEIDPMVMYFFEFKYEFDKDDLSYIWQNLAPRDYKKITFQEARVSHDLMNNELLDEDNLMDNPNLRWMVFKVKQKASKDYYDLVAPQVKAARKTTALDKPDTDKDDEYLQFNWPYDYLSFVELVKLEADVLYKAAPNEVPE